MGMHAFFQIRYLTLTCAHVTIACIQSHKAYLGWLGEEVVGDFLYFAEVCFREFGDRVKMWATFNEPQSFVPDGYGSNANAPGNYSLATLYILIACERK